MDDELRQNSAGRMPPSSHEDRQKYVRITDFLRMNSWPVAAAQADIGFRYVRIDKDSC
jgi:hypothetical protein